MIWNLYFGAEACPRRQLAKARAACDLAARQMTAGAVPDHAR